MKKIVKCSICGTVFETERINKKYCSLSCREAGKKLWLMKWKDKNPSYFADYMKKQRAAQKESRGANENN